MLSDKISVVRMKQMLASLYLQIAMKTLYYVLLCDHNVSVACSMNIPEQYFWRHLCKCMTTAAKPAA